MTRAIMVQGTTSNAGKSLMVAALCRIFAQDGYSAAPFKSQNMALNSFITHEGLEMGRAQVMQAEAAGIEPLVAMNPVLLKPTDDVGSQVIVRGEVLGNMSATDYFKFKGSLRPQIMDAYNSLAEDHDIIVIEGAGSPAEINLKDDDIVNMGMAKMAGAPVLIVGDIDRGGVFASLFGTIALLEEDERAHVKGTIINKFRGDKSLLDPGLVQLEELCGVPCLGVVPYLRLDVDDEDSLSERLVMTRPDAPLDICVVRLPHISNFTDLGPLERYPQVSVRYAQRAAELGEPDLVVLPGTKSTIADLGWVRERGFDRALAAHVGRGGLLLGICGGFQMLGRELSDPEGVEGGGDVEGLGLLPVSTVFVRAKTRTRVSAATGALPGVLAPLSNRTLSGYEIHMGTTEIVPGNGDETSGDSAGGISLGVGGASGTAVPFSTVTYDDGRSGSLDGCACGTVMGSYLHGMFESGDFAEALVRLLCERAGIAPEGFPDLTFDEYKQLQYDTLARAVRESLDMERVYAILEAGV